MSPHRVEPLGKGAKAIYQQLRQEIISGKLPQRTVLQQVELAERFGVSRTPVREALLYLAHDGLVEFTSGQTAHVSAITLRDTMEIRQIRAWLEAPALLIAIQQPDGLTDYFALMEQVRALDDTYNPAAGQRLLELDEQFHRWLLRAAGNQRAERIVGDLLDMMYREHAFSVAHGYRSTRDSLVEIEAAIRAGDEARVSELMVEHITGNLPLAANPVGSNPVRER